MISAALHTISGDHESVREFGQEASQLGRRLELRHRIELLEGAGEGVREAPLRTSGPA